MARFGCGVFSLLTFLAIAWMCVGFAATSTAIGQAAQAPLPNVRNLPADQQKAVTTIASGITGSLSLSFFACTGIPAGALFTILALMCYSASENERRHQERLAADHQRNDILGNMAVAQMAQAQLKYNEIQQNQRQQDRNQPPQQKRLPDQNGYWDPDDQDRSSGPKYGDVISYDKPRRKPDDWKK
jgi:hypothetical protein